MSDTMVECSNMGICNRVTGSCACMEGFEGTACNLMSCPGKQPNQPACNGRGECLSMSQLTAHATINGDSTSFTYGATPNNYLTWDFDMVQGCMCPDGFGGYDCSLLACASGDNPHTEGQVNEIQSLYCKATLSTGKITISFRRGATAELTPVSTVADLELALESLSSIVDVRLTGTLDKATPICSYAGTSTTIEFLSPTGDVPLLRLDLVDIDKAFVIEETPGTKENDICSGRGLCDQTTGSCTCFPGFGSSNGQGGKGTLDDCGYVIPIFRCEDGSLEC